MFNKIKSFMQQEVIVTKTLDLSNEMLAQYLLASASDQRVMLKDMGKEEVVAFREALQTYATDTLKAKLQLSIELDTATHAKKDAYKRAKSAKKKADILSNQNEQLRIAYDNSEKVKGNLLLENISLKAQLEVEPLWGEDECTAYCFAHKYANWGLNQQNHADLKDVYWTAVDLNGGKHFRRVVYRGKPCSVYPKHILIEAIAIVASTRRTY